MPLMSERVDQLLAEMTPAEKAGQLTQYFYFSCRPGPRRSRRSDLTGTRNRARSRRRWRRARSARCCSSPTRREINRLQRLAVEGNRSGIPVMFGFDVIHGLRTIFPVPIAMAASLGPRDDRARPGRRRPRGPGGRHPLGVRTDGRHRPRSALGPDHRGCGRGPVPRRGRGGRPGPRLPGRRARHARSGSSPGPKHFAGYGAAIGGRDYDEVNLSDSELWNVYLPPFKAAVEAGAGNIMTAYMEPQRHSGHRQRVAVHRRAARHLGLRGLRGQRCQRRRNLFTHGSPPTSPRPALAR